MKASKRIKKDYFAAHGVKTVTPAKFKTDSEGVETLEKPATKTRTVDRTESLKAFARRQSVKWPAFDWFANKRPQSK